MTVDEMEAKLRDAFPGCDVLVEDLTGTSNHFEVRMAAPQLKGQSRIAQQRSVMQVFDIELKSGEVHALTLKLIPKE